MRKHILALLALSTIGTATMISAGPAAAMDYPYCAQGKGFGYPGECAYQTYEQCTAAASGRGLGCAINPRVAFAQPQSQPRGRHYRHYDYND
jgi:hypothetical protein